MTETHYEVDTRPTVSLADKDDRNERAIRRYERHLASLTAQIVDSLSLEVALQFEKDVKVAISRRIAELNAEGVSYADLAGDTEITPQGLNYRVQQYRKNLGA